jgi:hypothetical protein
MCDTPRRKETYPSRSVVGLVVLRAVSASGVVSGSGSRDSGPSSDRCPSPASCRRASLPKSPRPRCVAVIGLVACGREDRGGSLPC